MRVLVALLASLVFSGCALLFPVTVSGSESFRDPAGYEVTCTFGPRPASSGFVAGPDTSACTQTAEARARTFLAQHPGATVDSVTVAEDSTTTICYTLAGQSACAAVSP